MRYKKKPQKKRVYTNYAIRAKEVRVVDETGKQLGVKPTIKAIEEAKGKGLDLIQVTEKALPPVCKIGDFGKFLYHLQKKERTMKQKGGELKEIRLTFRISDHDLETRGNQAEKFLKKGDQVRIRMRLRGRERALQDFAQERIKKFLDILEKSLPIKIDRELKKQPQGLIMVISKK